MCLKWEYLPGLVLVEVRVIIFLIFTFEDGFNQTWNRLNIKNVGFFKNWNFGLVEIVQNKNWDIFESSKFISIDIDFP